MKMKTPELEVVRFGAEDVIATSDTAKWSSVSYKADDDDIVVGTTWIFSAGQYDGGPDYGDYRYNMLDGSPAGDMSRGPFRRNKYYHYDENSELVKPADPTYYNWKTCTEPSHQYNYSN